MRKNDQKKPASAVTGDELVLPDAVSIAMAEIGGAVRITQVPRNPGQSFANTSANASPSAGVLAVSFRSAGSALALQGNGATPAVTWQHAPRQAHNPKVAGSNPAPATT